MVNTEVLANIGQVGKIEVVPAKVVFHDFNRLKDEANQVAEVLNNIIETDSVNEENVKEVKKGLAAVNKSMAKLDRERIDTKNYILEEYNIFAEQVKEIQTIVKNADTVVRNVVKSMEEQQREAKKVEIEKLYDERVEQYDFARMVSFDRFLQPAHLNKTTSMTKVEREMVEFLEKVENEITYIMDLENKDDVLTEYLNCLDMIKSIQTVDAREKEKERLAKLREEIVEESDFLVEETTYYTIVIENEKDFKLAKALLDGNDVAYTYSKSTKTKSMI